MKEKDSVKEKSHGGAVVLEAYRATIDSRLGRELFYVGFRVEETD